MKHYTSDRDGGKRVFLILVPGEEVNPGKPGIGLQAANEGGFESVIKHCNYSNGPTTNTMSGYCG